MVINCIEPRNQKIIIYNYVVVHELELGTKRDLCGLLRSLRNQYRHQQTKEA